ncbi:MAG: T9SS type A sorting domain-containing protein [Saprospiraceae bacterium]
MRNIIVLLSFICTFQLCAQKHDYVWMWANNSLADPGVEANILSFNNQTRTLIKDTVVYQNDQVNSTIADKDGNLLFAFDGCHISGADHQLIENGDSINYSSWWSSISNCNNGYGGHQNTLILPDPANEYGYYIMHKTIDWVDFPTKKTISSLGLKTTYVDMDKNGGKGKVIYKNKVVYQDTLMWGYLHAIKHANGKDWWIVDLKTTVLGGSQTNEHQIIKLDQNGAQKVKSQNFGPLFNYNSSAGGSSKFSPDGSKWCYFNPLDGLWFLDFDREKGEFYNYKFHNIRHKLHLATGLEWSPNSRFLYISSSDSLFQYDTWVEDLAASEKLVDIWDGSNDPFKTVFAKMQLGPDCRIYMSSLSSTKSIHVINNPDEPAPFCNFVQHDLKLFSSTGTISMPTFPNYRLDSGPVCDPTITTSSKDIADVPILNVMVYPNPTSAAFFVESAYQYRNAEIRILDMQGRNRWQGQHERILALHADMLEDGVYIVQLMNDHRVLAKEKLVVVR